MRGDSVESALLVNAEDDSMGGVFDGGVGMDAKASPRRAAIEKAQAELRQEYDVREERRRELVFLEKGGNPLDFKLGPAASISFQSISFTDQIVTSEAKGSFALTASPPGDSIESSGRPGATTGRETNTADNLLLFDTENDIVEGERNSTLPNRTIPPSEQSSQLDGTHSAKESEDLAIHLAVKDQAYTRRNRSRTSRDGARASTTDLTPAGDGKGTSALPSSRHGSRNVKGSLSEVIIKKEHPVVSVSNSKHRNLNGGVVPKNVGSGIQMDMELDAPQAPVKDIGFEKQGTLEAKSDATTSKILKEIQVNEPNPSPNPMADTDPVPNTSKIVSPEMPGETAEILSGPDCSKKENLATDREEMVNEGLNKSTVCNKNCVYSESSFMQIGDSSNDHCPTIRKNNTDLNPKEQVSVIEESPDIAVVGDKESSGTKDIRPVTGVNFIPVHQNFSGPIVKVKEETCDSRSGLKDEVELAGNVQRMESTDNSVPKAEKELGNPLVDESGSERKASYPQGRTPSTLVPSQCDKPDARFSGRGPEVTPELNSSTGSNIKMANKVHEDSVLEEARIIEAKRKRIAELSAGTFPLDSRQKSHWDFVLEEMAWLANDFMQERLWKTTVAAQVCHIVAFQGRLRFDRRNLCRMQKKVAHTLAKAIKQFWHVAEVLATRDDQSSGLKDSNSALVESAMVKVGEAVERETGEANTETSKLEGENPVKGARLSVQGYAVRFLKYTKSAADHPDQAEAPLTPDRISDLGIMEWEDQLSEEILFYTVPAGAMEDYRKSVELHWSQYQKSASNMNQEELYTSMFDAVSDFRSGENAYGEYKEETRMHYLAGPFAGSNCKSSKFVQKKRKNSSNSFSGRSYEVGGDLSYGHCVENKLWPHPSFPMGNRPSNNSNVGSIPTRRVRTASRQRFPVSAGAVGAVQFSNKTDASSGDTSSFQDDQSTVQGGSQIRKGLELESTGEFGKHLMPDCTEILMKPRKKKLKHSLHRNPLNTPNTVGFVMGKGSAYEQRWSLDSIGRHEQKDSKKRMESHAYETNGNGGIGGQHVPKKLKMTKHYPDTSAENVNPLIGSIPSPVASQVNNLANPNKHLKIHLAQNRGRKTKGVKMMPELLGSGSSWTQFEDQALVVLVHDMGPNWELVSDVINSTLQFKYIFRKPKDCKERHTCLLDKSAGDGADSADDSGSSQPYPSTLPGIPKGSARQLFQRLRGPMEEDTLKAHFKKIISIGQDQHSRSIQNDNQDQKQTASVHNSHVLALSQVCPNNLTGGPLTPLDLCDAAIPDLPLVHQGSHSSSLGIANQFSVASVLPTCGSGSNSMLQGSSGMALGNSLLSPSAAHNTSNRFSGQRPSLPMDEQQIMHYNNLMSGRNLQHSGLSVPGSLAGGDRGVRIVPGSNGMGMMPGMNRGTPIPRQGFQGVGPPSMLNMVSSSGSMHPATAVGMPNSVNMHNGSVSGQGSSMMRPRDTMHMIRPGQNPDDQRQMMMQELQMQQVTQGNSQGLPAFSGLSSGFSNQTAPPPGQTFPVQQHLQQQQQQQQSHVPSIHPQQPHHSHYQGSNPFVLRIAKDRQVQQQQRFMHQQQQQQFSPSNTVLSHGQPQSSQHPISTSLQNSSQVQQQASSLPSPNSQLPLTPSSSMNLVTSHPQSKHNHPHGLGRSHSTAGSLPSQIIKQRQRQQQQQQHHFQQTGRHLTPQRQQSQSHQQPEFVKGMGRGNASIMHQDHSADPSSHVNGLASTPGNQAHEKGEQAMHHMMQNQGLFSGSNTIQSNNLLVPPQSTNHSLSQQQLFSRSPPSSLSKQLPQVSSHSDLTNNQGQPPSVTPGHNTLPPVAMGSGQQQQRPNIHRMLQPHNCQMNSDPHMQSTVEQHPSNSRPHIGGTESSTNCMSVLSSDSSATPPWKGTSEYNSGMTKSINHLPGVGNPSPLSSTPETEPSTPSSSGQDLIHEQFSGSTTTQSNSAGTQWQPHLQQQQCQPAQPTAPSPPQPPSPPSPPSPPPPPLLQKQQPPQQPQPQPQPQQQLQAGQSGLYAKPSNSGPG